MAISQKIKTLAFIEALYSRTLTDSDIQEEKLILEGANHYLETIEELDIAFECKNKEITLTVKAIRQ